MNSQLQSLLNAIQVSAHLTETQKESLIRLIQEADKAQSLVQFKLDRFERDKHTLTVMLEESIEDLQKKSEAIEEQNRELEIESSLERVRTVAMSMNKPDDMLHVCRTISEQLELLKVKEIRNVQTAIFYEGKGTYMNYEYYTKHSKTIITETSYTNHEIAKAFAEQMLKGNGEFFVTHINGDEVKDWIAYQKTTNVFIDTFLETANSLNYYWSSLGPVALGISTYFPLTDDDMNLFKRFRNVFELSYRRYLDIEQALAQAREAKIEAALERVRARTMAMQHSNELAETSSALFQQIKELGFETWSCGFCIWTKNDLAEVWMGADSGGLLPPMMIPYKEEPTHSKIFEASLRGEMAYDKVWEGKELDKHYAFLKTLPSVKETIDILEKSGLTLPSRQCYYVGFFKQGYLLLITKEPNTELKDLSGRFASVFDLTYTRFLDLQKAEAQARESQIELGLERVRARAMAMQNSNELSELVDTVFKELTKLDFALTWCIINIIDETSLTNTVWAANPDIDKAPESYYMKFEDYPFHHAMMKGWKERKTKYVYVLEGLEKKIYDEYLFNETEFRKVPEAAQAASRAIEKYICSFSFSNFGGLQTVGDIPLSDDSLDILSRFGKVFDLTYTRFNDLKQAEAQARESQIQLALERVRARTMAMQHSDELAETASLLFKQINDLGIQTWTSGFNIWEENDTSFIGYNPTPSGDIAAPYSIPSTEDSFFINIYEAKKRGENFFVFESSDDSLAETYNYMKTLPVVKEVLKGIEDSGFQLPTFQINHCAFFSHGFLLFITLEAYPKAHDIFKRFGKVFEQTYTRFLDLQKAEAQAREAQIEAALERVRSRTMAMQRSDELQDTALLLFQQVKSLGVPPFACGFNIWDDDKKAATAWMARENALQPPFKTSSSEDVFFHIHEAAQRGESLFIVEQRGQVLETHYRYMASIPIFRDIMEKMAQAGLSVPSFQIIHCAFFSTGYLMFISYEPVPEAYDIFKRFAKVFEQTYTRFLDLQKAEAQAREAQIELALERVRARTMAMQRSDELSETSALLFAQIRDLGIETWTSGFNIWQEDETACIGYNATPAGEIGVPIRLPLTEDVFFKTIYDAKKRGEDFIVFESEGASLAETYRYMLTLPVVKDAMQGIVDAGFELPKYQVIHCVFFPQAHLMFITLKPQPEAWDIFKRFAKVFEQTYTRFLDLQKAEAQAREAQIQLSLERVRASAMAMHHSDELSDVLSILFEQFDVLGIRPVDAHLDLFDWGKNTFTYRATGKEGKRVIAKQVVDLDSREEWKQLAEKWKRSKPNSIDFSYYPKEVIRELMAFFPDIWAAMPEEAIMSPEDFPDGIYDTLGYCKFGYIGFHHYRKATEEEKLY